MTLSILLIFVEGNFIYQNYRQALDQIKNDIPKLRALEKALKLQPSDYDAYLQSEREYLEGLKDEPEEVKVAADYVDLLARCAELKYVI